MRIRRTHKIAYRALALAGAFSRWWNRSYWRRMTWAGGVA